MVNEQVSLRNVPCFEIARQLFVRFEAECHQVVLRRAFRAALPFCFVYGPSAILVLNSVEVLLEHALCGAFLEDETT